MLDFDSPLDTAGTSTLVITKEAPAPTLAERVTVTPVSDQAGYLAKEPGLWNWSDLRDYLAKQIEDRHGPQVRDIAKEAGICKGFLSRWGAETAVAIAKAAFEVYDGYWRNAPISITRFCKGSDPYFAAIIAERIGR